MKAFFRKLLFVLTTILTATTSLAEQNSGCALDPVREMESIFRKEIKVLPDYYKGAESLSDNIKNTKSKNIPTELLVRTLRWWFQGALLKAISNDFRGVIVGVVGARALIENSKTQESKFAAPVVFYRGAFAFLLSDFEIADSL